MTEKVEHIPLVSVIMPAYNAARYIKESVCSVQNQTITDWELIVVDDCSTDDTYKIARNLALEDERIRLIRNEENSGVAKTRNRAMKMVKGQYVAFLDSDDIWYPEKLEVQLVRMQADQVDLLYTSYRLIEAESRAWISDYLVPENTTIEDMLVQNRVGCSTVLMRRALAAEYRFTTDYYHEDYLLWLQMLQRGVKFAGIPEFLVDYRYYRSSKAGNKLTSSKHRWEIYRNYLGLSLPRSSGYMLRYATAGIRKYLRVWLC